jgi:Do/DeqQ family serine protease
VLYFIARKFFAVYLIIFVLLANPVCADKQIPLSSHHLNLSFAPLVKRVAPAVVNIFTRKTVARRKISPLFNDPFFKRFFGPQFGPQEGPKKKIQNSLGSGVIVNSNGTIVTNHHVIAGADEITVVLSDRREFDAKIIGSDKRTDLAILKINSDLERLPSIDFKDSDDLEVGDIVLAIGNPFGVGQTVTSGIVSALARTKVGISDLSFFIQTDAAINPGNSGGALVSMDGGLVGINSAIYSKGGGSVGIGFAIPTNMVQVVLSGLTREGKVVRPWIGVAGQRVDSNIAGSLGMQRPVGVLINEVFPNGPADRAGILVGDVIIGINKQQINDSATLRFRIATQPVGSRSKLKLIRKGSMIDLTVNIEAPPNNPEPDLTFLSGDSPLQGASVANLSPALADEIRMNLLSRGVVIIDVNESSPALRFGVQVGDIILKVNGIGIKNVGQLKGNFLSNLDKWNIIIKRQGKVFSVMVSR